MMLTVFIAYSSEGWIEDTCAGGKLTRDVRDAKWWATADEARAELAACDIALDEFSILPVVVTVHVTQRGDAS